MENYTIEKPIWNTNSIGIADFRLRENLMVKIAYKDVDGKLLYPGRYFVHKSVVKKYPIQRVKDVNLYIIPIEDLLKWEFHG